MTEPINIPIDMGIKPKANLTLTNTKTGEVQTMSMGAPEGMILDHYLDWAMERGLGLLGETTFNRCYLGTGNTPVQPTDTGLRGSQLAMSSSSVLTKGVTSVDRKFERLAIIDNLGIINLQGLAITSDGGILLVATKGAISDIDGLRAFSIDSGSGLLTQLDVPAFAELKDLECRGISCGGDYLVVGLNQAPWAKLYKYEEGIFTFVTDIPGLTSAQNVSLVSPGGDYIVLAGRVYKIIGDGTVQQIGDFYTSYTFFSFIDNNTFFARSAETSRALNIYTIVDDTLEITQTLSTPADISIAVVVNDLLYVAFGSPLAGASRGNRIYKRNIDGIWEAIYSDTSSPPFYGVSRVFVFPEKNIFFSPRNNFFYMPGKYLPIEYSCSDSTFTQEADSTSVVISPTANLIYIRQVVAGSPSSLGIYKLKDIATDSQSYARKWTFPAGTGTGVVNEVAVQATSGTGSNGNNRYFLRFVLPEGFEKTDLHQLEVEVEVEIENPGVWEGVISGGSRDGSDVNYRITMSENQFRDFITTNYNDLSTWFGTSGTPAVRIGTSNEDTDLVLDGRNIRGEQIEYISSTAIREVIPYVPGSLERTIRLFLEVNQGNGKIGEIVLSYSFCRITFDPPLNKYDTEGVDAGRDPSTRLYMNLVFGWKREGE